MKATEDNDTDNVHKFNTVPDRSDLPDEYINIHL